MTTTDEAKPAKLRASDDAIPSDAKSEKKKRVRSTGSLTSLILTTNPIVNRDALRRTIWRLEREARIYSICMLVTLVIAVFLILVQIVEMTSTEPLMPFPQEWLPYTGAAALLLVLFLVVPLAVFIAGRRVLAHVIREVLERDGLPSSPLPDIRHDPTTEL